MSVALAALEHVKRFVEFVQFVLGGVFFAFHLIEFLKDVVHFVEHVFQFRADAFHLVDGFADGVRAFGTRWLVEVALVVRRVFGMAVLFWLASLGGFSVRLIATLAASIAVVSTVTVVALETRATASTPSTPAAWPIVTLSWSRVRRTFDRRRLVLNLWLFF